MPGYLDISHALHTLLVLSMKPVTLINKLLCLLMYFISLIYFIFVVVWLFLNSSLTCLRDLLAHFPILGAYFRVCNTVTLHRDVSMRCFYESHIGNGQMFINSVLFLAWCQLTSLLVLGVI